MERDSCLVCGNTKITCQYSILVCKSCFSFFHRSMKNKKVYVCRRNSKQCKIVASEKKCQYCRLKRCESIGMSVKKIKVANQRIESVSHDFKIYFALLIFGHDNNLVSVFFDERQCYDITKGMLYDPEMSEIEMKSIHQIAAPMNSVLYKSVYEPIKRLNLDEMEFSFMMVQSLFSTNDLEEISSDTLLIAENSLTLANNEIHGYFVVNKRLENYASRLTEIMKIISQIQKYNHCRSDVYLVSKIFEIIDADNLYELKMDLNSKQMIFLMN
uniref:Nuclear receptor domain-containing protein n=1 Tax=Rhabditophanes sp. KR3021 TaxID=114890 RepID=A0AC35UEU4_9BILA